MKTLIVMMTCLATFAVLPPSASACDNGLDERCTYPEASDGPIGPGATVDCADHVPGTPPDGGVLGELELYQARQVYMACQFGDATDDALLDLAGDWAWQAGQVASGGIGLAGNPEADGFVENLLAVATSEGRDVCVAAIGENPSCPSEAEVPATGCPPGVEIPDFDLGGLVGATIGNANGALHATCLLTGGVGGGVPAPEDAADYVFASGDLVTTQAIATAGAAITYTDAVFTAANTNMVNTCQFVRGSDSCI